MRKESWRKKIERERLVKVEILRWIRKNIDASARLVNGRCESYDIYSSEGSIKVKEDRYAHQTNLYKIDDIISDVLVLIDWENVFLVQTKKLPKKKLVPRKTLLKKADVVLKRWFPVYGIKS